MLTESEETSTATNKKFWTYVNHRRGDSTEITAIKTDHCLLTDKKGMADALNNQFQFVFSPVDPAEPTDQKHQPTKSDMDDIRVHCGGVLKLLKDLKPNKASGPDSISATILKETADIVELACYAWRNVLLDKKLTCACLTLEQPSIREITPNYFQRRGKSDVAIKLWTGQLLSSET